MAKSEKQSLAEFFANNRGIDYQMKASELAREQIFLQKYTPLDNKTMYNETNTEKEVF